MKKTVIDCIMKDVANMEAADTLMTESLIALEKYAWETAYDKAIATLGISGNIEQRLAAILVRELASAYDTKAVVSILNEAYSAEEPYVDTVEAYRLKQELMKENEPTHQRLDESLNEFNTA